MMSVLTFPASDADAAASLPNPLTWDALLGVALFDPNGLPREYFVTANHRNTSWVQIVFQALGLRSLLTSSLQLEGFQQIAINLKGSTAIVLRRRNDYVALLVNAAIAPTCQTQSEVLEQWVNSLDANFFGQHPHFIAA